MPKIKPTKGGSAFRDYKCPYPGCKVTKQAVHGENPTCQHGKAVVTMRPVISVPGSMYAPGFVGKNNSNGAYFE
jgi:hypothetical protein